MEKDFIKALGYKALDNRLKRISDRILHDTRKFFKHIDIDVEPSWHLVFKLLRQNETLTMVDIAQQLGYSHPSTVVMLKKMTAKGFIVSEKDSIDKRKLNIKLTQKSIDLLPDLEQIWDSCEDAIYKMLNKDLSILKHIDTIEEALNTIPINERFYKEYQKQKR
ncbi:MarR family transcriptional regulator [Tamlana fucoidanivorans]|uniref:MarR family transcriptional regulator n=1 Tax=Allotamlana fucoidanivorans TaxID=2583814 RepID=A0A5C4SDC4_9FLAO|nr:MarR family transcriptional regulator [Tamlana fucoidanivorans]TNJ41199.1 MarR family transcriptional regulator [Tamlana fucoidanivorans]